MRPHKTSLSDVFFQFLSLVVFTILPRFTFVFSILLGIQNANGTVPMVLRSLLFMTPLYNLVFTVLVNCQDPEQRREMKKSAR